MAADATMVGFMFDLRLVACAGAFLLYALWVATARAGALHLARLGLLIAFAATVFAYALAPASALNRPFLDLFAFGLITIFLLLEFLFQLSVLGLVVSLAALAIAALAYVPGSLLPPPAAAPTPLVGYWGTLRDLLAMGAAAALTLGLGAGLLLRLVPDRRGGRLMHPNDLRDAASFLARIAAPGFLLAAVAGAVTLGNHPAPGWSEWVRMGALALLVSGSAGWLVQAEGRRWNARQVAPLVALNALALAALILGDPVVSHLTPPPPGP